jgi:EmrB/QacA subfamily drug resistance transporter
MEVTNSKENIRNLRILVLLFIGVLMGALDISIVGPAIPSIEKTIAVSEKDLAWIFSIYVLFNLVGISLMAKLSDYFGRRWIYILAVTVFAIGSLVVASSHDITVLLIGRAIQGVGSSGIFPVASAVIGDVFPVEKRGRALGLIGAVFGLAFILGPFIAGFMLRYFDWNALFLINIPLALVIVIFSYFLLPSKRVENTTQFDWAGIIMMGIILTAFTLGVNLIRVENFVDSVSTWPVLPLLLMVAILTPFLLMMERSHHEPVFNVHLFDQRQVRLVGFIAIGVGLFQSSIIFLPKLAVAVFGVMPSQASFMLLPVVFATALGSPLSGRLVDKIGSRIIIFSGLVISTVALFLLSAIFKNVIYFYIAEALLGLGLAMRASLNYIMLNEVSKTERASTQGILIIFVSIGQLTGAALIGAMATASPDVTRNFGYAFLAMGLISLILVFISVFLKSRKKELEGR